MKKIFLVLFVAIFFFTAILPVLAKSNNGIGKGQIKKYVRRTVTVSCKLVEIKNATTATSTELIVSVKTVWPKKAKKWEGTYPEANKSLIVKIDAKTKFVRRYLGKSSLEEMAVGDDLRIVGKTNEDGTINATIIQNNFLTMTLKVNNGIIESVNSAESSFVLKYANGKVLTIKVNEKTKIVIPGFEKPTFADLKSGNIVHVRGIMNNKTKIITATMVRVSPGVPLNQNSPTSTSASVR